MDAVAQRVGLRFTRRREIPTNHIAAALVVDHKRIGHVPAVALPIGMARRVCHCPVGEIGQVLLGDVAIPKREGAVNKADRLVFGHVKCAV